LRDGSEMPCQLFFPQKRITHVASTRLAPRVSARLRPLFAKILARGGNRDNLVLVLAPARAVLAPTTATDTTLAVTDDTCEGADG